MSQQAGWYDDPENPDNLRYWDGVQWTDHKSPKQKPNLDRTARQPSAWGPAPGEQQPQGAYGQQERDEPVNPYAGSTQPPYQWHQPMPGYQPQRDPRATTPDGQPLGGWGFRLLARIVDSILVNIVVFFLTPLVTGMPDFWERYLEVVTDLDALMSIPSDIARGLTILGVTLVAVGVVYETLTTSHLGGTLGKLLVGLRVRLRDQPGNLSYGPSALRALIWWGPQLLNTVGSLFQVLNGLWPLWDSRRQALHDKVVKTNVVRKRP